jgi:hypothetical protein
VLGCAGVEAAGICDADILAEGEVLEDGCHGVLVKNDSCLRFMDKR